MNSQEINRLLEKYYSGETTLAEERMLKEYFSSQEVPPELEAEKAQFAWLSDESGKSMASKEIDREVMQKISGKESLLGRFIERRQWFYATAGVAATILILLAIFVRFDPFPKKIQDTYNDPEVAYNEAKKILLFVSGQLNKGTDKLQPIATYNDGINELKAVGALNDGINAVEKIKKYNKIEQMVQKTN
jgi:hypothetical protein